MPTPVFARLLLRMAAALLVGPLLPQAALSQSPVLQLRPGDHLCLVGNGLGERMQVANYWETLLYKRFPDHELVVRNLCFPADEPLRRDRSLNFGDPDVHLAHSQADVVLYFFGTNEAFAGEAGLEKFTNDLRQVVEHTQAQNYSGRGNARVVIISPIAHEDLGDPNINSGEWHNAQLRLYTEAMREVARTTGAGFVDLFTPTERLFRESAEKLTINGLHLTDAGYRALAPILDEALFGNRSTTPPSEKLRAAIADKNFHWFHRYRAVNGYSIYGTRGEAGSDGTYRNREVMEREREILDQMCANRDRRIWEIAQGREPAEPIDDSNTFPFITPKSNVGGEDDPNRKAGKLGSLEYIPAAEQQKYFRLAPGYEIQLVASEEQFPELANPVALNFDNRGRLWVATMPSYPQWKPKTPMNDKLLILEDDDGDGRMDRCKVFADGLHQPTGFELGYGGVYVAQQPDLLRLEDTDGDDRADRQVRQLIGFDSADSHHGLAAFEWGPDGALYFQEGTFKQSQVETPYGPVRLGDAGVWRYEPRTERFDVFVSLTFANPWGHIFDRWGQSFIADASPGFNYWSTPISGYIPHPDKHPGGCRDNYLDWGGPRSDKLYPVFIPMRIRPSSGCEFVSSRHFPPEAQGNFLLNNVIGDLGILQHKVREDGTGFTGEEIEPLLLCDHGNFRPVDLQFGPDGALYIVDWHNALIGHLQHNLRDPNRDHSHGRIWRVIYRDRPLLTPPKIEGATVEELLELLGEPEDRTRYRVRRELAARPTPEVVAALDRWVAQLEQRPVEPPSDDYLASSREQLLLEALWQYQTHNVLRTELLTKLLKSPDHRARAAATRVACAMRHLLPDSLELIQQQIHDRHPRVRLEAVRACSFYHTPRAMEVALGAVDYEMDEYLEYTLDETLRALELVLGPAPSDAEHSAHGSVADLHSADDDDRNEHARGTGETHKHHAHHAAAPRPWLFLDASPRSIQYQIDRLSIEQLLAAERSVSDPRTQPIFTALLTRANVARQDREEALAALATMNQRAPIIELWQAMETAAARAADGDSSVSQLAPLLLSRPATELRKLDSRLHKQINSTNARLRRVAYAALLSSGQPRDTWKKLDQSTDARQELLASVPLVVSAEVRTALRASIVRCLAESEPLPIQQTALEALAAVPDQLDENFRLAAERLRVPEFRAAAVGVLLNVPPEARPPDAAERAVAAIVDFAEATPAAERTTGEFLEAVQLADELLPLLPAEKSRHQRERLRAVAVRSVRISTVHEEMRYDVPYFAVEAGRPVQLMLINADLMPHNLVITRPGALHSVALEAAAMSPKTDARGLSYVPESSDVLWATPLVFPEGKETLTFTAPSEPGEYPYICTLPNHWPRMYGVMVVVPDLDAWLAHPVPPADPLGNTRSLVKNWTMEDFRDLDSATPLKSTESARRLFVEATCAQCHRLQGEGGSVGPDLTDVFVRRKGDRSAVLREILDPSHQIEPAYALYNITTADGRVLSGIITEQNAKSLTIIANPDNPQPETIAREDIEELQKASTSLMPKGLLDRFTREEILELLGLLETAAQRGSTQP